MFRNLWFWFCVAFGALVLAGMFGGLLYLYGQLSSELGPNHPQRGVAGGLPL